MIQTIIGFLFNHFFEAIALYLVGLLTKSMVDKMGQDRTQAIKDIVVTAMYWAESEFGIGTGKLKWEKAWRKIRELLDNKGIKLTENEEKEVEVIMESYVPEINATTYSALPASETLQRLGSYEPAYNPEAVEYLRKKYVEKTNEASNEQNKN